MNKNKIIKVDGVITHLVIFNKKYKVIYINKEKTNGEIKTNLFSIWFNKTPPYSLFASDMKKWGLSMNYPLFEYYYVTNKPEVIINKLESFILKSNKELEKFIK